jgi:hypothetical protein
VVLLAFGLSEALGPDVKDETKITSQSIAAAGGVIFLGTWLWDLAGAQAAARRYNTKLGLSLAPDAGVRLALSQGF